MGKVRREHVLVFEPVVAAAELHRFPNQKQQSFWWSAGVLAMEYHCFSSYRGVNSCDTRLLWSMRVATKN